MCKHIITERVIYPPGICHDKKVKGVKQQQTYCENGVKLHVVYIRRNAATDLGFVCCCSRSGVVMEELFLHGVVYETSKKHTSL